MKKPGNQTQQPLRCNLRDGSSVHLPLSSLLCPKWTNDRVRVHRERAALSALDFNPFVVETREQLSLRDNHANFAA